MLISQYVAKLPGCAPRAERPGHHAPAPSHPPLAGTAAARRRTLHGSTVQGVKRNQTAWVGPPACGPSVTPAVLAPHGGTAPLAVVSHGTRSCCCERQRRMQAACADRRGAPQGCVERPARHVGCAEKLTLQHTPARLHISPLIWSPDVTEDLVAWFSQRADCLEHQNGRETGCLPGQSNDTLAELLHDKHDVRVVHAH